MENQEQEIIFEEETQKPIIKMPKTLIAVALTAVISVLASFTLFSFLYPEKVQNDKLTQIDALVKEHFYGDIDEKQISDGIMYGYVWGLGDKYSNYFSKEDTEKRNSELDGSGQGIGLIVAKHPDTGNIYVDNVYDDAPAAKAGLRVGDQITAVDSALVSERGYQQSIDDLIRENGATVVLTVLRNGKTFDTTVEYSQFVAQSVFGQMLESGIGYVEITSFNGGTYVQFKDTVDFLVEEGAKGLIFDLRNNGGGTVTAVTRIVDYLCPEGVIMTAEYADGTVETVAKSDADEINLPMAVLTNGNTASASEIFAANLREFKKAVIVGEKTYGNGVMQTTYTLSDGSSVSLTVAEFFTHSGESFNNEGIAPDVEVKLSEEELKYFYQTALGDDRVVVAAENELLNGK